MKKTNQKFEDYLNLPFEVYYSESLSFIEMEFLSLVPPKVFSDIKGVSERRGTASGLTFRCNNNSGPELACCILNSHDYIIPDWLEIQNEENIKINYDAKFAVTIKDNKIRFQNFSENNQTRGSTEYIDINNLMPSGNDGFNVFEFDDSVPDFIILDSDNTRIKVSINGYILDDNEKKTKERLFNPSKIENMDELMDFNWNGLLEASIKKWVKVIIDKNFPQEAHLEFTE